MMNSFLYSYENKDNAKRNEDKKGGDIIEHKMIERKKRNIQIETKYLENVEINKEFVEKALKRINEYRKLHGVNPLIQDDYLIKRAFILTQKKLTNFKSEDFLYKDGEDLGIIFEKSEKKIDVEKLIDNWYNENRNYNFIEPIELECNNFTQMIWKNSSKFGIGYFFSQENEENKKYYYAALFYPAGNIPGEYKGNIFKKRTEKNKLKDDKIKDKKNNRNELPLKEEIGYENQEIGEKEFIIQIKINTKNIIKFFILLIFIVYNLRKIIIEANQSGN